MHKIRNVCSSLVMLRPCVRRLAGLSGAMRRTFLSVAEQGQQSAQFSNTRRAALLGMGRPCAAYVRACNLCHSVNDFEKRHLLYTHCKCYVKFLQARELWRAASPTISTGRLRYVGV